MIDWLMFAGVRGAAWLLTYLVHSTLLFGGVLALIRLRRTPPLAADTLCKGAVVAALLTTTLATAFDLRPLSGRIELTPAEGPVRVIRELRTIESTPTGPATRILREDRVVRPAFPQRAHLATLVFLLWAVGAGWYIGGHIRRRRRLHSAIADRVPLQDGALTAWLATLSATPPRVTVSDGIRGPAAVSAREICLPGRLFPQLSDAERQSVLAHELAHLARRDPNWLTALAVARAALFFQPLHGPILRHFQRSAEVLCDDWAVAVTGKPVTLARAITRVAGWMTAGRSLDGSHNASVAPVPAMAEPGVPFVNRIERLVHAPTSRHTSWPAASLAALLLLVVALFAAPAVGAADRNPDRGQVRARIRGAVFDEAHVVREWQPQQARPSSASMPVDGAASGQ